MINISYIYDLCACDTWYIYIYTPCKQLYPYVWCTVQHIFGTPRYWLHFWHHLPLSPRSSSSRPSHGCVDDAWRPAAVEKTQTPQVGDDFKKKNTRTFCQNHVIHIRAHSPSRNHLKRRCWSFFNKPPLPSWNQWGQRQRQPVAQWLPHRQMPHVQKETWSCSVGLVWWKGCSVSQASW